MNRLITLTTDFGLDDAFVGVMKGVILRINPAARIVDLNHNVGPQNVREGAFVLATAYPYFPEDTVHLAVVDPGVGTGRRPIAVATPKGLFVAPDNGLLSYVLDDMERLGGESRLHPLPSTPSPSVHAYVLTERRFWLHRISATFHGRDIFAPVAAHLSLGVPIEQLGAPIAALESFPISRPARIDAGTLIAHVVYVDRFGNLITDARLEDLPPPPVSITIRGRTIAGLSANYAEGGPLVALADSSDRLEVALRNGDAAKKLKAGVGEEVRVERIR